MPPTGCGPGGRELRAEGGAGTCWSRPQLRRLAGVWGIVFVVLLLASAAMVSLPTAAEPSGRIASFYRAHANVIVFQQVVGAIALAPLVAFAFALKPNRWLKPSLAVLVGLEL